MVVSFSRCTKTKLCWTLGLLHLTVKCFIGVTQEWKCLTYIGTDWSSRRNEVFWFTIFGIDTSWSETKVESCCSGTDIENHAYVNIPIHGSQSWKRYPMRKQNCCQQVLTNVNCCWTPVTKGFCPTTTHDCSSFLTLTSSNCLVHVQFMLHIIFFKHDVYGYNH